VIGVSHFPTDGGVLHAKRNGKDMKSTRNFSPEHQRRKFCEEGIDKQIGKEGKHYSRRPTADRKALQ